LDRGLDGPENRSELWEGMKILDELGKMFTEVLLMQLIMNPEYSSLTEENREEFFNSVRI
jgi:hypothetical protein